MRSKVSLILTPLVMVIHAVVALGGPGLHVLVPCNVCLRRSATVDEAGASAQCDHGGCAHDGCEHETEQATAEPTRTVPAFESQRHEADECPICHWCAQGQLLVEFVETTASRESTERKWRVGTRLLMASEELPPAVRGPPLSSL